MLNGIIGACYYDPWAFGIRPTPPWSPLNPRLTNNHMLLVPMKIQKTKTATGVFSDVGYQF